MSATFDYAITRTIDAPVSKIWTAWTTVDQYSQWASAEDVEFDVRPGGAWSSVMVIPGGNRVPLTGVFTEVKENQRLVVGMNPPGGGEPVLMTIELAAEGDRTRVSLSQDDLGSAENRDNAEQGSNFLLDSLTAFLAKN